MAAATARTKRPRLDEAELEGMLFGRDELALQELGHEADGGGVGSGGGGLLADLLQQHAAAVAAAEGADVDDEDGGSIARGEQHRGTLLAYEDRSAAPEAGRPRRQRQRQAVWEDPQDAGLRVDVAAKGQLRKLRQAEDEAVVTGVEYEQRLRQQHSRLNPRTDWANLKTQQRRRQAAAAAAADSDDDGGGGGGGGSEEEEVGEAAERLLQCAGGLLARGTALPPTMLETTRLKDANHVDPCKGAVKSVEFHRNGELMLTAGLDRCVRLFTVDGVKNPCQASWYIEDMPVHNAAFAAGGSKVVLTGRRKFFYLMDVESQAVERVAALRLWRDEKSFESFVTSQHCPQPLAAFIGNEGHVPLVDLHSKQMVGTLKMNGTARTAAFTADGTQLLTGGGDGTVYVWDLRTQRCLQRYQDEGCLNGTSMACSPDGSLFATGSNSGVVNIYSRRSQQQASAAGSGNAQWALPEAPIAGKPLKSLMNLTTGIDTLAFNHDSQMLVMASRLKRDSLRVLHVPTLTVFSNWPTSKSPLHYVHSAAFSPNGGYLAIGNARGRVVLYRLHHYIRA